MFITISFDKDGNDEQINSWTDTKGHWASVFALLPGENIDQSDTVLVSAKLDISSIEPQYQFSSAVVRGAIAEGLCESGCEAQSDAGSEQVVLPWIHTSIP